MGAAAMAGLHEKLRVRPHEGLLHRDLSAVRKQCRGMRAQLEAGRAKHMAWHKQQGDTWTWHVWEVTTGPETGSYIVVSPNHQWQDLDAWAAKNLSHAHGSDVDAACRALVRDLGRAGWLKYCVPAAYGGAREQIDSRSLCLLRETLGQDWLTPDLFRFGASSLVNDILMQLEKQATGVYQSADYFSRD